MQPIALPLAALALMGAADLPSATPAPVAVPEATMRELSPPKPSDEQCRDSVTRARQDAGKPPLLDRGPASPDRPYLTYAVDKRVDGCSVMVMVGDPADIRPLPRPADRPYGIIPLETGR